MAIGLSLREGDGRAYPTEFELPEIGSAGACVRATPIVEEVRLRFDRVFLVVLMVSGMASAS
jgi:hypothetical protein